MRLISLTVCGGFLQLHPAALLWVGDRLVPCVTCPYPRHFWDLHICPGRCRRLRRTNRESILLSQVSCLNFQFLQKDLLPTMPSSNWLRCLLSRNSLSPLFNVPYCMLYSFPNSNHCFLIKNQNLFFLKNDFCFNALIMICFTKNIPSYFVSLSINC